MRRRPLRTLAVAIFVPLLVAQAASEEMLLRFGTTPDNKALLAETIQAFNQDIQQRAPGLFLPTTIELPSADDISSALMNDLVDVAIIPASRRSLPVGSYVSGAGIQGSRSRQQSEVGALELAKLEENQLVGLAFWNTPARIIASRDRLAAADDLLGLKILANDPGQRAIIQAYGANPVSIPFAETYSALQAGVIDAVAFPAGNAMFAPLTQTVIPDAGSTVEFYLVSRKAFWSRLSTRGKSALVEAAKSAGLVSDAVSIAQTSEMLIQFTLQGANILPIRSDRRNEVFAAALSSWSSREDKPDAEILSVAYAKSFGPIPKRPTRSDGAPAAKRTVFFATNRADTPDEDPEFRFGTDRTDGSLVLGTADVEFQAGRNVDDDLTDVSSISSVTTFRMESDFRQALSQQASGIEAGVLVFVHGYSNRFTDVLRRAAHIATATGFSGPVIAFSWPSEGATLLYNHDEDRIQATQPDFRALMLVVDDTIGRHKTNLLAHSMGARILLGYVDTLSASQSDNQQYRSITIAAGDTPNEVLARQVDFLKVLSPRVTVYFSEKDRALWLSNQLHTMTRVGNNQADQLFLNSETAPFSDAGFDFVDARFIDDDTLTFNPRHSYLFDKQKAVEDYSRLVVGGVSAEARQSNFPQSMSVEENDGKRFWRLIQD